MAYDSSGPAPTSRWIWALALWCGVVMAAGESLIFFAWKAAGSAMFVSADIVWAALLVDTAVCLLVAAVAVVLVGKWPRLNGLVAKAFAALVFVNWAAVALHDRIHVLTYPLIALGLAQVLVDWIERSPGRLRRVVAATLPWMIPVSLVVGLAIPTVRKVLEAREVMSLPPVSGSPPNVLILLIDALRGDHLSAVGYERPTSPRIDEFALGGVLFEEAYATSSYTLASHASILTGLLPHQHAAEWVEPMKFWDCDCPMLGEVLQERGYVTAGFSANPFWFTHEYGFARGFHRFEDFFNRPGDVLVRTTFGRALEQIVLPRLGYMDIVGRKDAPFENRRLLRWLDGTDGRPFFAFVNYFDVHDPYLPPEPYRSSYAGKPVGGIVNWRINGLDPVLEPDVIEDEKAAYDGAISYVDAVIGELLDTLRARGTLDNTIVVITSDHGEEFGEHDGLMLHGHGLHRQSVHVPLIIRGPGVPSGVRVTTEVSNAALPSTIMDLAFEERGFPMTSLLTDDPSRLDAPISELVQKPWGSDRFPAFHGAMQSVADGGWHLIRHDVFDDLLYDVEADPAESENRAGEPEQAQRLEALNAVIDSAWAEAR